MGERIYFSEPKTWGTESRKVFNSFLDKQIQIVPVSIFGFLVFQPRIRLEKFIADKSESEKITKLCKEQISMLGRSSVA